VGAMQYISKQFHIRVMHSEWKWCFFSRRIMYVGLKITRPPDIVARYKMIRHAKRKPSDWRKRLATHRWTEYSVVWFIYRVAR